MPKIPLSLDAAKAKDSDILAKLGKVKQAAVNQKQQGKLGQQRLEWVDQARRFAAEARRLEDDLQEAAGQFSLAADVAADLQGAEAAAADVWFQVAGVRQLLRQVQQRDPDRLAKAPDQALELQAVVASVSAALGGCASGLATKVAQLEQECSALRAPIRRELTSDGAWSVEQRHNEENRCDLSDEEDILLDRIGDGPEEYEDALAQLNEQVRRELGHLEGELAELRKRRSGWDDEANFRFACIRQQFQGKGRDLLVGRLLLEFPHISREQLQAHEAHCDALKFSADKRAAVYRQWRRDRLALLRRHQGLLEERHRGEEALAVRRQEIADQRGKQRQLHAKLQVERARASSLQAVKQRAREEEHRKQQWLEQEREQAQRRRAEQLKKVCRAHSEQRHEADVREREEALEREAREAKERAARQERNAARVRIRSAMDEMKHKEQAQQRAAAEQERREREHRLEKAMERLRVEAPRDPERLLKVPEHAKAEQYVNPVLCANAGRGPHAGFDEGRLMADARYKLSAALQAAGLYHTKAGQAALLHASAPRAAVPHEISSVFAGPPGGYPG